MKSNNLTQENKVWEIELKAGAISFFAIALLSIVDIFLAGRWSLFLGLGITELLYSLAHSEAVKFLGPDLASYITIFAIAANLVIAAIYIKCGILTLLKKHQSVFMNAMVIYLVDLIILIFLKNYWGISIHILILIWIFIGFNAGKRLQTVEDVKGLLIK